MFRVKLWRPVLREISRLRCPPSNTAGRGVCGNTVTDEVKEPKFGKFKFYKSRGQHILTNPRVLDAIIRKSGVLSTDTVLEIGPGTGNLTVKLLEFACRVIAVEIDPRMVDSLLDRISNQKVADKLQVIAGDALKIDFPEFDLCVANIPYGISSPLVAKLLIDEGGNPRRFRSATILLQKEFAKRMVAKPGDSERNRFSVNVGLMASVNLLMDVSKKDFLPPPKVDSSLVKIQPKINLPEVDLKEWENLVRICFCQKRKTLGAIFKQKGIVQDLMIKSFTEGREDCGVEFFREKIVGVLREGGFMELRATALSEEDMLGLLSLFNREGIRFHSSR